MTALPIQARQVQRAPLIRLWSEREIIVDSFAGGGGASTGIRDGLGGRDADIAINHDAEAISLHMANHPLTKHYQEDVWKVDPVKATGGRPVGIMWLSPDCKHYSKARGAKPVSKKIRGLAWVGCHWARTVRPRIMFLENVEEFESWGPTIEVEVEDKKNGGTMTVTRPCPKRKGQTFKRFVAKLRGYGYAVEWRQMSAMNYDTPTTRNRLFMIARCDGRPIVWPEATNGEGLAPLRTAGEIIDWSIPTQSIFGRKKDLAPNTLARIANGMQRYVIEAQEPFIVRHGHYIKNQRTTFRGQGLGAPLGVVCATNDKNLVVPEVRPVGTSGGGSAQPLIAAWIAKHYGGVVGHDMYRPLGTVTSVDHHSLVTAFLVQYNGTAKDGQSLNIPLKTVIANDRFALVTIEGKQYEITDIGFRMLQPRELYNAQGFPIDYNIESCHNGKILTKEAQTKMAGNSVCPRVAKAIVEANTDGDLALLN